MKHALVLRFDAPMMSFGGTAVDNNGVINQFPLLSMVTGLLANAAGYSHEDTKELTALQERIDFAARCDRPGRVLVDFHTVDLGQDFLRKGWTTRGEAQGRAGSVSDRTHIRYRHYLVDSIFTLVVGMPSKEVLRFGKALRAPARPLFLGRACCVPAVPIYMDTIQTSTLRGALETTPLPKRAVPSSGSRFLAQWPCEEEGGRCVFVVDERDWSNQVHVGRRLVRQGLISVPTRLTAIGEAR